MKSLNEIKKAIMYITNIRDENFAILDNFKKEIEENKDNKTSYSTLIYDNRISNCNTILEALEKQIPTKPIIKPWCSARCAMCGNKLSEDTGDGYFKHLESIKVCDCGQKLKWD